MAFYDLVGLQLCHLIDWLIDDLINENFDQLIDWLVGWFSRFIFFFNWRFIPNLIKFVSDICQAGLQGKARRAVVGTFDLEHQSVKKSLHLVREYFRSNLIRDQGLMESEKGLPVLLKMLEDPDLISSVQEAIDTVSGSERRWEKLTSIVSRRSPTHVYKLFLRNCKVFFSQWLEQL